MLSELDISIFGIFLSCGITRLFLLYPIPNPITDYLPFSRTFLPRNSVSLYELIDKISKFNFISYPHNMVICVSTREYGIEYDLILFINIHNMLKIFSEN